jgi:hypothetical protein
VLRVVVNRREPLGGCIRLDSHRIQSDTSAGLRIKGRSTKIHVGKIGERSADRSRNRGRVPGRTGDAAEGVSSEAARSGLMGTIKEIVG